jgi:hypothetical protein
MPPTFTKATKLQAKLRLALIGPSGSGKTYSALAIASGLGGKIALIDTEHGSASKYADLFSFDSFEPESFSPETYIEAITAAEAAGYDVLIIDSLSHAWAGKNGILEFVDKARDASAAGDAFGSGWRKATPKHNSLVDAMLGANLHLIATMRSKTEYIVETLPNGKTRPRKVGMQPVQRDGIEFEFDVSGDLDQENTLIITKSRCPALSGQQVEKPGAQLAATLKAWLTDGAPVPPPAPKPAQSTTGQKPAEQKKAAEQKPTPATATQAAETTAQAATQRQATMANGLPRPWDAEHLKERFAVLVASRKTDAVNDGYRGLVAHWLELCFVGKEPTTVEAYRHSLVRYLTDKESMNDLTPQELRAFGFWLAAKADSGGAYTIGTLAEQEAQRVITVCLKDAGQQELPLAAAQQSEQPAEEMSGEALADWFDEQKAQTAQGGGK